MNYKIEHNKGFRIVGAVTREHMTMEDCMEKVPQFWKRTHEAGLLPKIWALMDGSKPEGVLGVSACDGGEFSGYYIAVATKAPCPEELEEYDVPEGDWAVFDCVGKMPEAIQNLQRRIMTEWLPTSGYAYAPAPDDGGGRCARAGSAAGAGSPAGGGHHGPSAQREDGASGLRGRIFCVLTRERSCGSIYLLF